MWGHLALAPHTIPFRYFGDSEGEPRSQLFPLHQVEDVRNAITWLSSQPEVDPQRIGIWGTSYGGGIVVTFDRRIRAVWPDPERLEAGRPAAEGSVHRV
jgi:dienelactone hydrolase